MIELADSIFALPFDFGISSLTGERQILDDFLLYVDEELS